MATILVLVEHSLGECKKVTFELLTKARELGDAAAVVLAAPGQSGALRAAIESYGAGRVYVAESADFDDFLVAPKAEVLAQVVTQSAPAAVLIAATPEGKEIAARLAVKTGSGLITDAVDVRAELVATQNIFGGSTVVQSRVRTGVAIITMRPNSVAASPAAGGAPAAEVIEVTPEISDAARGARVTERVAEAKTGRPDLTEAAVIVSGGRGVGAADNFALIEKLADSLGAAVGASRAATDAGWYPHQFQVGQTGKTVSPQLYVAVGISGAIQHRAGMQTSKTIVAINKDAEAPIFELADFGLVGDLFQVVPQLTEEVAKRR